MIAFFRLNRYIAYQFYHGATIMTYILYMTFGTFIIGNIDSLIYSGLGDRFSFGSRRSDVAA